VLYSLFTGFSTLSPPPSHCCCSLYFDIVMWKHVHLLSSQMNDDLISQFCPESHTRFSSGWDVSPMSSCIDDIAGWNLSFHFLARFSVSLTVVFCSFDKPDSQKNNYCHCSSFLSWFSRVVCPSIRWSAPLASDWADNHRIPMSRSLDVTF